MVQTPPSCTLPALLTLSWLSCYCCWLFQPLLTAYIHLLTCVSDCHTLSVLFFFTDMHNRDTGQLTHFDSHSTVQYAPDLSASSLLFSLLFACLCPPFAFPCPLWPLLPCLSPSLPHTHTHIDTHTHTQINRHRNIFIHTDTHCAVFKEVTH